MGGTRHDHLVLVLETPASLSAVVAPMRFWTRLVGWRAPIVP